MQREWALAILALPLVVFLPALLLILLPARRRLFVRLLRLPLLLRPWLLRLLLPLSWRRLRLLRRLFRRRLLRYWLLRLLRPLPWRLRRLLHLLWRCRLLRPWLPRLLLPLLRCRLRLRRLGLRSIVLKLLLRYGIARLVTVIPGLNHSLLRGLRIPAPRVLLLVGRQRCGRRSGPAVPLVPSASALHP